MTPEERMDRLETLVQTVVDGRISLQKNLDNIIADLAEMTRRGLNETPIERQRSRELDERIAGLVSAISELIRRGDAQKDAN